MHREFKTILAALIALTSSARLGSAQTYAENPQVSVSVYDDASVPSETLARAEARAANIFRQVGLDVNWLSCTAKDNVDCNVGQNETTGPDHLVLRIIPTAARETSDTAFGIAYLGSDGSGRYGDVFWERARALQGNSKVDVAFLLGSVMAHEMGHLLLGSNAHAVSGIMRAHWEASDLRGISMNSVLFLPGQGKRMRERVSRREDVLVSRRRAGPPSSSLVEQVWMP